MCEWKNLSEDPIHRWERMSSNQLEELNRPGPTGDIEGHSDTFFMIASNYKEGDEGPEIAVATLKSPLFKRSEHPKECFAFWFYFGQKGNGEKLSIILENGQGDVIGEIWRLHDKFSTDDIWMYGTVPIQPQEVEMYSVLMIAEKGDNNKSFVALDEFEFIETENCNLNPPEADPDAKTTPQPTEPPGRKEIFFIF